MAFTTAAVVGTAASVGSAVVGGKQSKKAASAAAAQQREASARADEFYSSSEAGTRLAGEEARGIVRGAANEYSGNLGILSPYQEIGTAGRSLLGRYAGIEDLQQARDVGPAPERPTYNFVAPSTQYGPSSVAGYNLPADIDPAKFAKALEAQDQWHRNRWGMPLESSPINPAGGGGKSLDWWPLRQVLDQSRRDSTRDASGDAAAKQVYDADYNKRLAAYNVELTAYGDKKKSAIEELRAKNAADPEFGSALRSFTEEDFVKAPGYEFRRGEGTRGLTNLYGTQGQLLSGNALRGLNEFNQEYASGEFQNAYERDRQLKERRLGLAQNLLGTGQRATESRVGGYGNLANLRTGEADVVQNTARSIASSAANRAGVAQDVGNIGAAESVAKARAYTDMLSGVGGGISSLAGNLGRGYSGGGR